MLIGVVCVCVHIRGLSAHDDNTTVLHPPTHIRPAQWTAAVGMIQRDEADVATCCFTVTHSRSKVAEFTPGINYFELYWFTRYPRQLSPTWNLLGLFTPFVWMWIGLSIFSVSLFMIISARCYTYLYHRIHYVSTEVVLIPFR